MNGFKGTFRLTRLALRRDRVKLPIIILAIAALFYSSAVSVVDLYGSEKQQYTYASTTAPSVVSRIFGGPIDGPNIGAIVINETFLFTALAAIFMSTLATIRHTRQNEEEGRSELVESAVVGRYASLSAALIVVAAANVVLASLVVLSLVSTEFSLGGSIATGGAIGSVGLVFGALAAVTAQLSESSRGANSLAALAVGIAFLLRAIGDSTGSLTQAGLGVDSAFPSWLSPIGWGQQIQPFTQGEWWIFGLFAAFFVVLASAAFCLLKNRDIGLGLLPARLGPARAAPKLLSPFGLAKRLQRGTLRGWAAAVVVLATSYGLVIKEFDDLLAENEELSQIFSELGGDITNAFIGIMVSFMAIVIAGYGIQALLRMRSEETGGQLESLLGVSMSRQSWMLSHISFVFLGVVLLTLLSAASMGVAYVASSGEKWSEILTIAYASFTQLSAVLALLGFVVALFSLLPRLSIVLAWGSFSACLLIMQFGPLLELPQWVINLSPFAHAPMIPAEEFSIAPVAWLVFSFVALTAIGISIFQRRDVSLN